MQLLAKFEEPRILFRWIVALSVLFITVISCFLMKISPVLLMAFLSSAIYIIALFYRSSLGAYAYASTLGFAALLNLPMTQDGLKLSTILVLLALLVWIAKALLTADRDLILKPLGNIIHILLCVILLTMVISLVNSRNLGQSIGEIKQFIYCLVAYFVILFNIKDFRQLRKIIIFTVCTGFIVSVLGIMEGTIESIYSYLHNKSAFGAPLSRTILWTSADRINGLIGDGDSHGIYMSVIFLFSLYLFLTFKPKILKTLLLVTMLTSLFNIIGAGSRGAALGFLVSLFVFWIFIDLRRKWLILTSALASFLIIAILMIVLIPDLNIERFYDPKAEAKKTVGLRVNNLIIGLAMTKNHPIIGNGPDGFTINYLRYGPRITPSARRIPTKPLNAYLQALVEYGIVGLTLFLAITIFIIKSFIRLLKNVTGKVRYLVAAIFAAFCGYTFFLNTTGFFVDQTYWLLVALAGTLISIYNYETKKSKEDMACEN
ncbi:MAG: O-antigen ligase family protein [Desulfobacteraceae bacterium]|nr:O-antigen ligase family protein [Desulfobacteraceae bacterium]MBC2720472.1 O-antigen ligase family protein [Desulfobacteraceae bacterium]